MLGFPPGDIGHTRLEAGKHSCPLEMQMARSAYLCQQASRLTSGKVIVGNELRDAHQRRKFVEQMFTVGQLLEREGLDPGTNLQSKSPGPVDRSLATAT